MTARAVMATCLTARCNLLKDSTTISNVPGDSTRGVLSADTKDIVVDQFNSATG